MIVCYHTQITKKWANDDLHHKLGLLPQFIRDKITRKQQHLDMQLSVSGYLLLLQLIDHFGLDLKLDDLQYSEYQRPYFAGGFDFNISHSGNRVICCGTTEGKVGVDIEQIKPIDINYNDYFTVAEQQNIRAAKNPTTEVLTYWARKEAVLKAIGTGVFISLLDIDVSIDEVIFGDMIYKLLPIDIDVTYVSRLACTTQQNIEIYQIDI